MKKITLIIAALAFLTIASCKKEEEKKSKTDYLTSSPWKMTGLTVDLGAGPVDIFATIEACEKDDTQKYNVGGTGLESEGATKCDPADPQSEPFTWAFAAGETQLVIDGETATINTLDANTLSIKITDPDGNVTATFSH